MQCQILGVSRHARMGGLGQACLLSFSLFISGAKNFAGSEPFDSAQGKLQREATAAIPFPLKPIFLAAVADAMICQ